MVDQRYPKKTGSGLIRTLGRFTGMSESGSIRSKILVIATMTYTADSNLDNHTESIHQVCSARAQVLIYVRNETVLNDKRALSTKLVPVFTLGLVPHIYLHSLEPPFTLVDKINSVLWTRLGFESFEIGKIGCELGLSRGAVTCSNDQASICMFTHHMATFTCP